MFSLYMLRVEAKDPETMAMEFWRSLSSVWLIARFIYYLGFNFPMDHLALEIP